MQNGMTIASISPGKPDLTFEQTISQGNACSGPVMILKYLSYETEHITVRTIRTV